jgi:hypothetical protein
MPSFLLSSCFIPSLQSVIKAGHFPSHGNEVLYRTAVCLSLSATADPPPPPPNYLTF